MINERLGDVRPHNEADHILGISVRTWFIAALFIVVFFAVRIAIPTWNTTDYDNYTGALRTFLNGGSPYQFDYYYLPPWAAFILAPIAQQPLATWLALYVAIFVAAMIDLGELSALLLILTPTFFALIFSSNPEWLFVGTGLWLIYRLPRGWGRGLAWLLLTCKPQTTVLFLLFDGIDALRQRDWKAIGLAAFVSIGTTALYPDFLFRLSRPVLLWSMGLYVNYGLVAAIAATIGILLLRRRSRLPDLKTLGLLLMPIWAPDLVEYSYLGVVFTMRKAGWIRNSFYIIGCLVLAYRFWRDFHIAEPIGALGMVLLAALLAPIYLKRVRHITGDQLHVRKRAKTT